MSEKEFSKFVTINKNNRIVRYRKSNTGCVSIKSGILERYTYKTDTGELLPDAASMRKNKNETIRIDCDSTTDDFNTQTLHESDSDCQIVDVKKLNKRKKVRKSQVYMIYSGSELASTSKCETPSEIHVISDSDDDGMKNEERKRLKSESSTSGRSSKNEGDMIYEISDNIRITLPKEKHKTKENCSVDSTTQIIESIPSKKNITTNVQPLETNETMKYTNKSSYTSKTPQIIINEQLEQLKNIKKMFEAGLIVNTVLNNSYSNQKTTDQTSDDDKTKELIENDSNKTEESSAPVEKPSRMIKMFETLKEFFGNPQETFASLKRTSNNNLETGPKCDKTGSLSPETMKTEFYSYLKINTNPNARKTENTMKNRRSIRVRNLYKEIVKEPPMKVEFPLPKKELKIENLDDYIETYFKKENIDYKQNGNVDDVNKTVENKKKTKKPIIKLKKTKKTNRFHKKLISKTKKLKLRKIARMLRSKRLTRHSLIRISQKQNLKKIKRKRKTTHKPETSTSKTALMNPLDRFDLLAKNYMHETNYYNPESPTTSPTPSPTPTNTLFEEHNYTKTFDNTEIDFVGFGADYYNLIVLNRLQETIRSLEKNIEKALEEVEWKKKPLKKRMLKEFYESPEKTEIENENEKNNILPDVESDSNTETIDSEIDSESEEERLSQIESGEEYDPEIDSWSEFNQNTIQALPNVDIQHDDSEQLLNQNVAVNRIHLDEKIQVKPFHRSLLSNKNDSIVDPFEHGKEIGDIRKKTHQVSIDSQFGPVLSTYYIDGSLIVVQEYQIGIWKQTPLGNVLGSSNMWCAIGKTKRYVFEKACVFRKVNDMVSSTDGSVAYIEVWTKEHSSEFRQVPVTDIFVTVYHHKGYGALDKKVVQLENIKGYGKNVSYCVMRYSREVVVSWRDQLEPNRTYIRAFELASDYQTVVNIREFEEVYEEISSMHVITNCDSLVIGCADMKLFVWNIKHGWIVKTINFISENDTVVRPTRSKIKQLCLRAMCETGYLFLVQQMKKRILRLVGVNGSSGQWKQLQVFRIPRNYNYLMGTSTESGVLMASYPNGFLCFDMQTGQMLAETKFNQTVMPADKFLVYITEQGVVVKHAMFHILECGVGNDECNNESVEENLSKTENLDMNESVKQQDKFETFVRSLNNVENKS